MTLAAALEPSRYTVFMTVVAATPPGPKLSLMASLLYRPGLGNPLEFFSEVARTYGDIASYHIAGEQLFLALALLQFSPWVRARWIKVHRWSGRLLIAAAVVATVPTYYFGVMQPYGGSWEAVAIVLFAVMFLGFLTVAYLAIRRGDVTHHREWMIRAFAVALGISTVRVVGFVFDFVLTPAGLRPPVIFVLSIWTGWFITVAAAELWIRKTHVPARAEGAMTLG